jgi:magnesium transporter
VCVDEDMMAMYLTDKKNNVLRELHDHEDLEVLLESFAKQVEEIVNEAQNMEVCMFVVEYHYGC